MKKYQHSLPYHWSATVDGKTYELHSEEHTIRFFENGVEKHSWTFDKLAEDEEIIHFGNIFVYHFDRWLKGEQAVINYLINYLKGE